MLSTTAKNALRRCSRPAIDTAKRSFRSTGLALADAVEVHPPFEPREVNVSNTIAHGIEFHPTIQTASRLFPPFTSAGLQPWGLDLNTCDYLGIANDNRLNMAQARALADIGASNFNAPHAWPREEGSAVTSFQERCAEWMGYESVILTKSCFESNLSLFPVILADQDLPVYMDKLIHATIRQGVRAANMNKTRARPEVFFKHNDVEDLRRAIEQHGPGVISVESIYSQLGTVAPLGEIAKLARETGCILHVDESHSMGNVGSKGHGLVAELGLQKDVQFITASLGKTFGCQLGLIACSHDAAHHLTYSAVPLMFSWAAQDERAVRALEALRIIKSSEMEKARQYLANSSQYLRKEFYNAGFRSHYLLQDRVSPIISFVVGETEDCMDIVRQLWERDIYTFTMAYPAAPKGKAMVRLSCNTLIKPEGYQSIARAILDIVGDDHLNWRDHKSGPLF